MQGMTETGLRTIGLAFNAGLFLAFAWGCLALWSAASGWATWAGGLPPAGLAAALVHDPSAAFEWLSTAGAAVGYGRMAGGWAAAWACAVASAGCGYMALLGGRQLYHAATRLAMRLP